MEGQDVRKDRSGKEYCSLIAATGTSVANAILVDTDSTFDTTHMVNTHVQFSSTPPTVD